MSTTLRAILYLTLNALVSAGILYGMFSFVLWNTDPAEWSETARFMAALLWGGYNAICAIVMDLESSRRSKP
jgi:hypothetical protein